MATTKYIVDNLSGQTINGDITINGDFTVTGTTNIRPYKVFTALLTQSGTGSTVNETSGPLIVGVSYNIDIYNVGDDFSNVGGPGLGASGEWEGYWFIATGTTPNNWNNSSLLISNEGAPVVTVLENTIGNIWFTFVQDGSYFLNLPNGFPINKTFYDKNYQFISPTDIDDKALVLYAVLDFVSIYTTNYDLTTPKNDVLLNTPIEIRVYN
jgi:hypothetical protein